MLFSKRVKVITMALMMCLLVAGCGGGQSASGGEGEGKEGKKIKLVAAHDLAPTHPYQIGFEKMKELVQEKSNGTIDIEIHPSEALGAETAVIEGLQMGTIDLTTVSAAPLTGFVKEYKACDLPFMFENNDVAWAFYDGKMGEELFQRTEEAGLIGLAWWENGFRNFTNSTRPLLGPKDFNGLKIRTMSSPVHMALVKALGGDPVPIEYGEVYSALQQKVVDGQENPVANIVTGKFHEVQKYLTLSKHVYDPSPLFISKKTWDKLTDEQKEIIQEAAIEARDCMRQAILDGEAGYIEEMKNAGVQVSVLTPEQWEVFKEATKDVYKQFEDEIGKEFLQEFFAGVKAVH